MRSLLGLLLSTLLVGPAVAYPIPPVTAWELADRAELVVVARVEAVLPLACEDEDGYCFVDSQAHLSVQETWKGEQLDSLLVPYSKNLICPAPANYEVGKRVLAFLVMDQAAQWRTAALSYGTLYPTDEELSALRRLVKRAVRLHGGEGATPKQELDWLVRAACEPATRWHGVHRLAESSRLPQEGRGLRDEERVQLPPLTDRQRERLAEAFVRHPPELNEERIYRSVSLATGMLALLDGHEDEGVDELAASLVDTALALEEPTCAVEGLIVATLERLGDESARLRLLQAKGDDWRLGPERARAFWAEGREQLESGADEVSVGD